ncbi:MAG: NYN domain-containing protein [Magnetococcales bacterium]|nr:NYN domain-containing protein [Magnetococcales bacterium]MBF0322854.1 NYN domain-containing protein [Magnetococcales bacterium]
MPPVARSVVAYVDGFNLYYGLRSKNWRKYYWLDLVGLSRSLLKVNQTLIAVHYFTARIRLSGNNDADVQRQSDYLDALAQLPELTIHFGHFLNKPRQCRKCGAHWMDYEEKMTDVNIATQILTDAFDDRFDTALLLSADSDLTTPVQKIRHRFPQKRVIVVQPPGRISVKLCKAATAAFTVGEAKLRQNQLPPTVIMPNGHVLQCPDCWK